MKRYRWCVAAAGAVVALVVTGCSSAGGPTNTSGSSASTAGSAAAADTSPAKVTIAIPAGSAAASFIQLAVAAGLTKENGLDVTLITTVAPPDTPAALESGSIQASALTSTATQANAKGLPVVNVVNTGTHAPLVMLGAPGLKTISDLKGKTVVTSAPTDTPGTETAQLLKNAGIASSVKVVSVASVPGRSALFDSGQADAVYEALNLALKDEAKRPGSSIIGDNTSLLPTPADGLAVTKSFLASNQATVSALVKSCIQAAVMMKNSPTQAAPYLKTIYGLNDSQVQQFLQRQGASLVITGVPSDASYGNQAKLFNAQPTQKTQWTEAKVQASWDTTIAKTVAQQLGQ
jgi:ABC-type nitrate/sulfonate/bicarbonate transport system substrate-binding protein